MTQQHGHKWMKSYRKLIDSQISYLKYSGFGSIDSGSSAFLTSAYFVYKIWILTTMYIFAITVFADIYVNRDNLSISTDGGCIFAGIFVIIYKAMNYQFREKRIRILLDDILKCIDNLCEFSEVEYIKELIDKYYKRQRIIIGGFSALGFTLTIVLLLFSPMETGLPIRAQYPFNTTASPSHEIGFTIEACAISGGLLGLLGIDGISSVICVLLTQLFDMLNANFENCTNENHEHVRSDAFEYFDHLPDWFSGCCGKTRSAERADQIVIDLRHSKQVGGQNSDIIKFGIYLSAGISQLFYICWIGNELSYMVRISQILTPELTPFS
ncbi:hypothetical protein K0M31_008694 [Melipona bicolor]|uniref:Odorant receptor n=1 Tax=Melipona bicolor TaxID=60889 RepID=A0AA40FQB4_9HYME|nr:hypothetical protein K0M31_008694 [Melipona bicolor]